MYGSARKSYLQMLEPIHNQGVRLCLGIRISAVERLYVDAFNIKSLQKHSTHEIYVVV